MRTLWIVSILQAAIVFGSRVTKENTRTIEYHELPAFHAYNAAVDMDLSDPLGALDLYRTALEIKPDFDDALLNIGSVYRQLGDIDSAMLSYERLLNLPSASGHHRASACNNIGHLKQNIAGKDVLNLKQSVLVRARPYIR
jgi:tetratricopeptide (TPR) repeat protein